MVGTELIADCVEKGNCSLGSGLAIVAVFACIAVIAWVMLRD